MEFAAGIHGIKIDNKKKTKAGEKKKKSAGLMFGSPEDYADMSKEEKQELTNKMLGKFKSWAGEKGYGSK